MTCFKAATFEWLHAIARKRKEGVRFRRFAYADLNQTRQRVSTSRVFILPQ